MNSGNDWAEWLTELTRCISATVTANLYIPAVPTDPQAVFLFTPQLEVLFGGAAGGGKSAALLMAALQYVDRPGYSAILFRRTFADLMLPGALIPLSHEWLSGTPAKWDSQRHQWQFPSGAALSFGYLDGENDHFRYQGAEFQFIGVDELTQHREHQYRYLLSRLRRKTGVNVPLRVRSASNPGGIGHEWVRQRFLDAKDPARIFVPAKLEDNPHLDRIAYEASLNQLDPVTRAQLRHGDWSIRPEGNLFKRAWFDTVDDIPHYVYGVGGRALRMWDLAATEDGEGEDPDYTASCRMIRSNHGVYYIADVMRFRARPSEVQAIIHRTARSDGYGTPIRIEQEPGSAGKSLVSMYARQLEGFDVRGVPARGDKVTRAQAFSAACERGDVKLLRGNWINGFLDELCAFPEVGHDDQVDAATGCFNCMAGAQAWSTDDLREAFQGRSIA